MLQQNYLRVFENESGSVTIVTNEDSDSTQQLTLQSITIHRHDLHSVARALIAIADEQEDA